MKMTSVKLVSQSESIGLSWNGKLSFEKKLDLLRDIFGCSLDKVNFWDLYRTVKRLKSQ